MGKQRTKSRPIVTKMRVEVSDKMLDVEDVRPTRSVAINELQLALRNEAKDAARLIMNEIGSHALHSVTRMKQLTDSEDENVAFKSSAFMIDHVIGKAVQKSLVRSEHVNVDVLAD